MALPFVTPSDLPAGARVCVYGTGAAGRALVRHLRGRGACVAGYIDSFRDGALDGLPIHRLDRYLAVRRPEDAVLIGSSYGTDIERRLVAHGITDALDGLPLAMALLEQDRMAARVTDGRIRLTRPEV